MPCIFCIAVFTVVAGQVTAVVLDRMVGQLEKTAKGPVRKTVDTEAVAKLECDVEAAGKVVPVALTVMKDSKRVRIQVLTHDIARDDAEKLQNHLAEVLDLRIVDRSDPESEAKVREAFESPTPAPSAETARRGLFGRLRAGPTRGG